MSHSAHSYTHANANAGGEITMKLLFFKKYLNFLFFHFFLLNFYNAFIETFENTILVSVKHCKRWVGKFSFFK